MTWPSSRVSAQNNNANNAREELSKILRTMEDSVTQTARGRCRPEVLASMPAVQKLRGAVNRHKLALETAQMAERNRLLEEETAEKTKRETEEKKKIEEEEMKKMRATADLDHREKRRQDLAEALMRKKLDMFTEAKNYLEDAREAVKQGNSAFCKMTIPKVNGTRRHAKSFLADAKAIYIELRGTDQRSDIDTNKKELQGPWCSWWLTSRRSLAATGTPCWINSRPWRQVRRCS